jgi:NADH-quinone oxidoreductase subunit L
MIMGAGLGAYDGAMFHFLTHAFFKALLFLAAGIVIHALAGEQSLDRFGGLARPLRYAFLTVAVGCLAIAGIPGFSGFFSKDEILASALEGGDLGVAMWVVGTIAAGLTAFYMFRLLFRTFLGREPAEGWPAHPHPSGWVMALPVGILAVGATVIGWIQVPGGWHLLTDWLEPVFAGAPMAPLEPTTTGEVVTSIVSTVVAVIGIGVAWWLFVADPDRRLRLAGVGRGPRRVVNEAYGFDDAYDEGIVEPGRELGDVLLRDVEPYGPAGLVAATVEVMRDSAAGLRRVQSGLVRTYAFAVIGGLALMGVIFALALR